VICLRDHLWHRRDLGAQTLCAIRYRREPALTRARPGPHARLGSGHRRCRCHHRSGIQLSHPAGEIDHLGRKRWWLDRPAYLLSHPSVIMGLQSIAWIMA
jgi:hypothetical protein